MPPPSPFAGAAISVRRRARDFSTRGPGLVAICATTSCSFAARTGTSDAGVVVSGIVASDSVRPCDEEYPYVCVRCYVARRLGRIRAAGYGAWRCRARHPKPSSAGRAGTPRAETRSRPPAAHSSAVAPAPAPQMRSADRATAKLTRCHQVKPRRRRRTGPRRAGSVLCRAHLRAAVGDANGPDAKAAAVIAEISKADDWGLKASGLRAPDGRRRRRASAALADAEVTLSAAG